MKRRGAEIRDIIEYAKEQLAELTVEGIDDDSDAIEDGSGDVTHAVTTEPEAVQ